MQFFGCVCVWESGLFFELPRVNMNSSEEFGFGLGEISRGDWKEWADEADGCVVCGEDVGEFGWEYCETGRGDGNEGSPGPHLRKVHMWCAECSDCLGAANGEVFMNWQLVDGKLLHKVCCKCGRCGTGGTARIVWTRYKRTARLEHPKCTRAALKKRERRHGLKALLGRNYEYAVGECGAKSARGVNKASQLETADGSLRTDRPSVFS